jgi:hypothetical protein
MPHRFQFEYLVRREPQGKKGCTECIRCVFSTVSALQLADDWHWAPKEIKIVRFLGSWPVEKRKEIATSWVRVRRFMYPTKRGVDLLYEPKRPLRDVFWYGVEPPEVQTLGRSDLSRRLSRLHFTYIILQDSPRVTSVILIPKGWTRLKLTEHHPHGRTRFLGRRNRQNGGYQ